MGSGTACVTLLKTKRVVKDFQEEKGFRSFSEALRFIIEDYFRLRNKLDESRDADFERVCDLIAGKGFDDFNKGVVEDLSNIKGSLTEIRNMIALISQIDSKWLEQFQKYFPKYFK
jgi:hypothetical protein